MGTVYALLIGINDYPEGTESLQGCLNDVENVRAYLTEAFVDPAIEVLTNADATYANVISAFRSHLGRAGKGDVAYLHYSGHGARSRAAPEFHQFDRDLRDQGLVCVDSRVGDNYDLADKELAALIAELARNEPHIALLLDCCHSGSGTRDLEGEGRVGVRGTGEGNFPRRIETYLEGYYAELLRGGMLAVPQGRHILMAAADRDETAKEDLDTHRGIFTTAFYDILREGGSDQSYAELYVRARARVHQYIRDHDKSPQRPQFEPVGGFDGWGGFLGQARKPGSKTFVAATARANRKPIMVARDGNRWMADAGAIAGLPLSPAAPVTLSLAPEDQPDTTAGTARVTRVGGSRSEIVPDFAADPAQRYVANVTSLPPVPLRIAYAGPDSGRAAVTRLLASDPAMRALLAGPDENDDGYRLALGGNRAELVRSDDGKVAAAFDWTNPDAAGARLLDALGHIAQWQQLLALGNPAPQLDPAQVDFGFAASNPDGTETLHHAPAITLGVTRGANGKWEASRGQLRVRNQTGNRLYFTLLHFTADFGVNVLVSDTVVSGPDYMTIALPGPGGAPDPAVNFWLDRDQEAVEQFKLVLGTEPIDAFMLEMAPLVSDRGFGGDAAMAEALKTIDDDWFALDLRVRVTPKLATVGAEPAVLAGGQITVDPHASVTADLALVTPLGPSRGVGADADFSARLATGGLVPAGLAGTRGDAIAALDITGISDPAALGSDPLMVRLALPVGADEVLVPMVRDGAHLLPAGDFWRDADGSTQVAITSLPTPLVDQRSLGGSLRLWFFKSVVGIEQVNRLRLASVDAAGKAQYGGADAARAAVDTASRVLIAIHGIIGDTKGLVEGLYQSGIAKRHDCVLAYDYENLSTPIDQTARQLALDLAAAGLRADDGKTVTIVAHSMGGLVSRWFIEKEGGAAVVDHLVMCGTPNAGSPFGEVGKARKVLQALFAIGANFALPVCASAAGVLAASAKLTPTLEQMAPDSELIRALNGSPPPSMRYTIIAGDLAQYRAPDQAFFEDLLAKVGRSAPLDLLFGGSSNDIAVKLSSIRLDDDPDLRHAARSTVACHHLNYFSCPAGQVALQGVDWG